MTARSNPKQYQAEWRKKNPEKVRASAKKFYDKNKNDPEFKRKMAEGQKKARQKSQTVLSTFVSIMISAAKGRSKKKGFTKFDIDTKYITNLVLRSNGICQGTGLNMSAKFNCPYKASLDRINSKKGYVKGNVRIVATIFNYMKQDYTDKQFAQVAAAFIKNNGLQTTTK